VGSKTSVRVIATTAALGVLDACGISRRQAEALGKNCSIVSSYTARQRLAVAAAAATSATLWGRCTPG